MEESWSWCAFINLKILVYEIDFINLSPVYISIIYFWLLPSINQLLYQSLRTVSLKIDQIILLETFVIFFLPFMRLFSVGSNFFFLRAVFDYDKIAWFYLFPGLFSWLMLFLIYTVFIIWRLGFLVFSAFFEANGVNKLESSILRIYS